jgi:uncharacterized metal-binding protein YceD (DUF177 family)
MMQDVDGPVLSRPVKVDEIRDGASGEVAATHAELGVTAEMLDLVALDELRLAYRFDDHGAGRLRLTGTLHAKVTQTCVISLDPVEARIELPVEVEFWPERQIPQPDRSAAEPGTSGLGDWPEAIVDGRIDLGPVLYESLATALDPYPKREDASFAWSDGEEAKKKGAGSSPFAALAALKRR